jgi:hypothetical protein
LQKWFFVPIGYGIYRILFKLPKKKISTFVLVDLEDFFLVIMMLPMETSWSLPGPGVEVGLTPNFMKGIHIFPLSIVGSFFFFFLPSKLDVQCMVIVKKEKNKILFQNPFKLMFNKYNKQCKVRERHLNSYFYKVCNDSKNNVCFNIVVGFGN